MSSGAMGMGRVVLAAIFVVSLVSSHSGAAPKPAVPPAPIGLNVPNLEGYWPLDTNAAGITPDQSPNAFPGPGNDGTLTGGAAVTGGPAPVPAGNVASLVTDATAATQQFVDVADAASLRISGPITLAAWVMPTIDTGTGATDPVNAQKCIIEKWVGANPSINGYFLRLSSASAGNNVPLFSRGDATGQDDAQDMTNTPLTLGTWTHVAGVFDGTNMTLYVGGVQRQQIASTRNPTAANTANLHLGKDYGTNVFTGNIDEARVYSFGATAGQIGTLVAGVQPPPTGTSAAAGPSSVTLTWTAAANARSYNIYQSINGGAFAWIGNSATLTYTDSTATNTANTYSYEVTAAACLESVPDTATTPVSPAPPAPRVKGHETNNLAHRCGCSSIGDGAATGLGLAALAVLLVLIRKK